MKRVSRRELGQLAAGIAAASALPLDAQVPAPAPAQSTYIGPLTGVTSAVADRRFDPVAFTRDLYAAAPRRLRFQARTRADAERWQAGLRAKLTELVGGFPAERVPLRPMTMVMEPVGTSRSSPRSTGWPRKDLTRPSTRITAGPTR